MDCRCRQQVEEHNIREVEYNRLDEYHLEQQVDSILVYWDLLNLLVSLKDLSG